MVTKRFPKGYGDYLYLQSTGPNVSGCIRLGMGGDTRVKCGDRERGDVCLVRFQQGTSERQCTWVDLRNVS